MDHNHLHRTSNVRNHEQFTAESHALFQHDQKKPGDHHKQNHKTDKRKQLTSTHIIKKKEKKSLWFLCRDKIRNNRVQTRTNRHVKIDRITNL